MSAMIYNSCNSVFYFISNISNNLMSLSFCRWLTIDSKDYNIWQTHRGVRLTKDQFNKWWLYSIVELELVRVSTYSHPFIKPIHCYPNSSLMTLCLIFIIIAANTETLLSFSYIWRSRVSMTRPNGIQSFVER